MNEDRMRRNEEDVLDRRARELAETAKGAEEGGAFATITVVAVGAVQLGLPVESLKEIVPRTAVTPLPGLPPWISGIAQIRGVVIAVVHLGRWLGLAGLDAGPFFAVIAGPAGPLALEIDAVSGLRSVKAGEIAADLGTLEVKVPGLVRAATKDLVMILDPQVLLASEDVLMDSGTAIGRKR